MENVPVVVEVDYHSKSVQVCVVDGAGTVSIALASSAGPAFGVARRRSSTFGTLPARRLCLWGSQGGEAPLHSEHSRIV
ncbi:MAG: hypothetical protein KF699_05775 [Phycisphaeraceae bacterium]|nr:hypothetical protein [Phycisphaeraceae bacterium]